MTTKSQINQFITDNKSVFTQGTTIPEAQLCEWFNITRPARNTMKAVQRYNLSKLSAYCRLNRYLSSRGLVISSVDYGSHYIVRDAASTERMVGKLEKLGTDKLRNASELAAGITRGQGKWKKLTRAQLSRVRDFQADTLFS